MRGGRQDTVALSAQCGTLSRRSVRIVSVKFAGDTVCTIVIVIDSAPNSICFPIGICRIDVCGIPQSIGVVIPVIVGLEPTDCTSQMQIVPHPGAFVYAQ